MCEHPWLPALCPLGDCDGDWAQYAELIYGHFRTDFLTSTTSYQGRPVGINRTLVHGKEATFWHLISEGKAEDERTPDMRRCERIRWPRQILVEPVGVRVRAWRNKRGGKERVLMATEDFCYLVVLALTTANAFLVTAYYVEEGHRRRKLAKEYEAAQGQP
jgi:hypothetical protein